MKYDVAKWMKKYWGHRNWADNQNPTQSELALSSSDLNCGLHMKRPLNPIKNFKLSHLPNISEIIRRASEDISQKGLSNLLKQPVH